MTTTRHQRTPLGAFYRSPLGAFGPGGKPPLPTFFGLVQEVRVDITGGNWAVRTADCQGQVRVLAPNGCLRTTLFYDASVPDSDIPQGALIGTYTFIGQTSGERYRPNDYIPYVCNSASQNASNFGGEGQVVEGAYDLYGHAVFAQDGVGSRDEFSIYTNYTRFPAAFHPTFQAFEQFIAYPEGEVPPP